MAKNAEPQVRAAKRPKTPAPRRYPTVLLLTALALLLFIAAARYCGYQYVALSSDVLYMNTALPTALYFLSNIADIAAMFTGYALLGWYLTRHGVRRALLPFLLALLSVAVSYVLTYYFYTHEYSALNMGALLTSLSLNFGLECGRLLLVGAGALLVRRFCRRETVPGSFRPFRAPENTAAFLAAALVAVSRAAVELFGTTIPFFTEYSDITAQEYFSIAVTYFLILLSAALGYFLSHFIFLLLARAENGPTSSERNGDQA